ncbi:hypothetical protein Tco_1390060 [Tanacetum coccineum]
MMMKIMYAIVLFFVMSTVLSVSSNIDGDQETSMVVDDPVGISKPEIGGDNGSGWRGDDEQGDDEDDGEDGEDEDDS